MNYCYCSTPSVDQFAGGPQPPCYRSTPSVGRFAERQQPLCNGSTSSVDRFAGRQQPPCYRFTPFVGYVGSQGCQQPLCYGLTSSVGRFAGNLTAALLPILLSDGNSNACIISAITCQNSPLISSILKI